MTFSPGNPSTVARSTEKIDNEDIDLISLEAEEILELNNPFREKNVDRNHDDHDHTFHSHSNMKRNIILITSLVLLTILTPAYADRAFASNKIANGTEVEGVNVGGMSKAQATKTLESSSQKALNSAIRFSLGDDDLSVSSQDIDLTYDIKSTVENAYEVGKTYNPFVLVPDFFERTFSSKNVNIVAKYDQDKFDIVATNLVNQYSKGRVDAGVTIEGTNVKVVDAKSGSGVSLEQAKSKLKSAVNSFDRNKIILEQEKVQASISLSEANETAEILRTMFSNNSTLTTPSQNTISITKEQLAASVVVTPKDGKLVISIDETKLRPAIADQLSAVEVTGQDATFAVAGNSVSVVPSVAGKQIDFVSATKQWIAGKHDFAVLVKESFPKRDTKWAQSMNITNLVSSFTTNFPAGQDRVKNIRKASEVVSGTIVEPGQTFSLNDALGPRSAESGYVQAPVFADSKGFFADFGGGISQYSTTLFNASYIGGYKQIAHKPHTIYISRYPLGREATLNFGSVDMKFKNDTKSGILIRSSVGATSITVSLYGNNEGRIVTMEGPITLSRTEFTTEYVDDPTMPVGKEKELEHGYPGIAVENYRTVTGPGLEGKKETYRWTYKMIPKKVARGTAPAATPAT